MDDAFLLQAKIRENARGIQEFSSDLKTWESSIKEKDAKLRYTKQQSVHQPATSDVGFGVTTSNRENFKGGTAAEHCYDKGYKKWEKFDADQVLHEKDEKKTLDTEDRKLSQQFTLTPAGIVEPFLPPPPSNNAEIPAITVDVKAQTAKARDVLERERGNEYFGRGDMDQAVKFYTRAIGFNPSSVAAFSNRAMARLKLKDFSGADVDCCDALAIEPTHIKTLLRRATARNSLGRHRAAFLDLLKVRELDQSNKQALVQINQTRELIRNSVRRTARHEISVTFLDAKIESERFVELSKKPENEETPFLSKEKKQEENLAVNVNSDLLLKSQENQNHRDFIKGQDTVRSNERVLLLTENVGKKTAEAEFQVSPPSEHLSHNVSLTARDKAKKVLASEAVQTLYEFERIWKELKGYENLAFGWLTEVLQPRGLAKLFSRSPPEADLFLEMLILLFEKCTEPSVSSAIECALALCNVKGLDMTLMFLTESDKRVLLSGIEEVKKVGGSTRQLEQLKLKLDL